MTATEHEIEYGVYPRGGDRDRRMINDPMGWPQLRLPVKNPGRYDSDVDNAFGVLDTGMAWPDERRIVHVGNLYLPLGEKTEEYESTDALLDAGWVVD